jgi:hypothetical protein
VPGGRPHPVDIPLVDNAALPKNEQAVRIGGIQHLRHRPGAPPRFERDLIDWARVVVGHRDGTVSAGYERGGYQLSDVKERPSVEGRDLPIAEGHQLIGRRRRPLHQTEFGKARGLAGRFHGGNLTTRLRRRNNCDLEETVSRSPIRGGTGISLGIAAALVSFFAILPVLVAVSVYTFLTIYAIVKAIGSAPDSASALSVLMGIVAIVGSFVTLIAVDVYLIGRDRDKPIVPTWLRRSSPQTRST